MSLSDNIFALVPIEVLSDRRLSLEQMRVLVALLSFRGKNTDIVWPSRGTLAERAGGMHPANVSKATTALVGLGWLEKDGNGGRSQSSTYRITVPDLEKLSTKPETVAESATYETVADSATQPPETVAESATKTVADSARGIEQTIEHTIKSNIPVQGQAREADPELVRDRFLGHASLMALKALNVPIPVAEQWLEIRKRKSQPELDKAALETMEADVWKVGLRFEQAVECCVNNGWAWFKSKWYADLPSAKKLCGAKTSKASTGSDWRGSPAGVLNRGRELGIAPLVGESQDAFRDRVRNADWQARRNVAAGALTRAKEVIGAGAHVAA